MEARGFWKNHDMTGKIADRIPAAWLARATGSNKLPYFIERPEKDKDLPDNAPPVPDNLFAYRTRARRHQVVTEIEK